MAQLSLLTFSQIFIIHLLLSYGNHLYTYSIYYVPKQVLCTFCSDWHNLPVKRHSGDDTYNFWAKNCIAGRQH